MWRTPTVEDLTATLSDAELNAYKRSASFSGADPATILINRTVQTVRGYCRAGAVAMSPDESTIPEGLISPAMDYCAFDLLKRLPIKVGEDRKKARDDAVALFESVATGKYKPESFDKPDSGQPVGVLPSFGEPPKRRLLDSPCKLKI